MTLGFGLCTGSRALIFVPFTPGALAEAPPSSRTCSLASAKPTWGEKAGEQGGNTAMAKLGPPSPVLPDAAAHTPAREPRRRPWYLPPALQEAKTRARGALFMRGGRGEEWRFQSLAALYSAQTLNLLFLVVPWTNHSKLLGDSVSSSENWGDGSSYPVSVW